MIKLENTDVYGFEAAIRGMRNPMNSWDKSDSWSFTHRDVFTQEYIGEGFHIGENDLKLMKSLSKAGNDHGKFLRMITVTVDVTAPLYWWKEFDTYKVGTVANSCSTMHKIHEKEFTIDDFSHEKLSPWNLEVLQIVVDRLEENRKMFLSSKIKYQWEQMIQLLPSSYNQKRTVQMNYQVLKQMYFARRNHRLDEWHTLCDWIEDLPYFREVVIQDD